MSWWKPKGPSNAGINPFAEQIDHAQLVVEFPRAQARAHALTPSLTLTLTLTLALTLTFSVTLTVTVTLNLNPRSDPTLTNDPDYRA